MLDSLTLGSAKQNEKNIVSGIAYQEGVFMPQPLIQAREGWMRITANERVIFLLLVLSENSVAGEFKCDEDGKLQDEVFCVRKINRML